MLLSQVMEDKIQMKKILMQMSTTKDSTHDGVMKNFISIFQRRLEMAHSIHEKLDSTKTNF